MNSDRKENTISRIVMFCADYGNIPSVLFLIEQNYRTRRVTLVILDNHDLFQFFEAINNRVFHQAINLIYVKPYHARRAMVKGIKKVWYLLPDIITERRYLKETHDKYFAQVTGCEIYFFSRSFSGATFYLLNQLSKRNSLIYMPYQPPNSPNVNTYYAPANIVDLARILLLKSTYGRGIAMGKYPQTNPYATGFPYIPDKFMEERVSRVITSKERTELLKGFDLSRFKVFDAANSSVIYFDDGLVESRFTDGSIDRDTFRKEMAQIFSILTKYFPEAEIARKYHPGYDSDQSIIATGKVLPSFIPAEFLYNDNTKMYLSVCSYSLANVEKGLAVSIIDLLSFPTEKLRNQFKENLIRVSRSKILFPKTLDEFESIVMNARMKTREAFT